MKAGIIEVIKILLSMIVIYGVYMETGVFTLIFSILVWVCYVISKKNIEEINKKLILILTRDRG